jgi:hypothetical protein
MKLLLAAALLGAAAVPARSQVLPEDREIESVFTKERRASDEPTPVAQALVLALGATFFNEVRVSTAGPVTDLSRLNRAGFYKRELIALLLISSKGGKPLKDVVARRRKGESLRGIALAHGLDYDAVYDSALMIEELLERDYLPRFRDRRPRKSREEP